MVYERGLAVIINRKYRTPAQVFQVTMIPA